VSKRLNLLSRTALYLALLAAMALSAAQLFVPKAKADIKCCTYGNQCARFAVCCLPEVGQAPCSATNANYCYTACPA
jgi:hypothetical protein